MRETGRKEETRCDSPAETAELLIYVPDLNATRGLLRKKKPWAEGGSEDAGQTRRCQACLRLQRAGQLGRGAWDRCTHTYKNRKGTKTNHQEMEEKGADEHESLSFGTALIPGERQITDRCSRSRSAVEDARAVGGDRRGEKRRAGKASYVVPVETGDGDLRTPTLQATLAVRSERGMQGRLWVDIHLESPARVGEKTETKGKEEGIVKRPELVRW